MQIQPDRRRQNHLFQVYVLGEDIAMSTYYEAVRFDREATRWEIEQSIGRTRISLTDWHCANQEGLPLFWWTKEMVAAVPDK
jgi:hypothetical protein